MQSHSLVVPDIVHQVYDYKNPSFFLFMSIVCIQHFLRPTKHILWVNDEGKHKKNQWYGWQSSAANNTWEGNFSQLISRGKVEVKFVTFPTTPPGNASIYVSDKAHRSDFVRMKVLQEYGGIYMDTDAYPISSLDELRKHEFTMAFDNLVNPDLTAPKRLNNGIILSTANSTFLSKWSKEYSSFDPSSWAKHSSEIPFFLATQYPDLIHIEWSRISPISFGFQTSETAAAITCGIFNKQLGEILYPRWIPKSRTYTYENVLPNKRLYEMISRKLVLHLTMTGARGYCMMRKNLQDPSDLAQLPSLLGHYFRTAFYGFDKYDYSYLVDLPAEKKMDLWKSCRNKWGIHYTPNDDRQQFVS